MKFRLIVGSMVLFLAASLVWAQAPGRMGAGPRQQMLAQRLAQMKRNNAKGLGLTPEQKAKDKTIREQARLSAQPTVDKLRQNREALNAAVKAGDAAKIAALSKTQGELQGEVLAIRGQAQAQVYAGLTNEQRQKLDERQSRMKQRLERLQAKRTNK